MSQTRARWLFADQLGPHYIDDHDGPVILIEARSAFARRRYHRAKAHLVLSALRHRAHELGDRAVVIQADSFGSGLDAALRQLGITAPDVSVIDPTSYAARRFVRERGMEVLPARGFVTSEAQFAAWAAERGRRRLLMEDFYRSARRRTGILMEGAEPAGGRWNYDIDNRQSPPRGQRTLGLPTPSWPVEDEIDASVRRTLRDWEASGAVTLIGDDSPRLCAASRQEALVALEDFVRHRLSDFGPFEDAVLDEDWLMAHSLLSAPLNLGLLEPGEVIDAAVARWITGDAPLSSVEGFVRQIMGWRDYVWHLYWHLGEDYVSRSNALDAHTALPAWWRDLDAETIDAACLRATMGDLRERGWTHHIPRLMILGNFALQRGYEPVAVTEWFTATFVDAYPWVMAANVVGMALFADGGVMATKPYAAGGAYLNRMTDHCGGCRYRPQVRIGEQACPFTAGYWWFMAQQRDRLQGNHRMAQALRGLDRLADLDAVVEQESRRGDRAP